MSMHDVLSHPVETSLSVVEQLKLARNIVYAVLKFNSTLWLKDYFSLCDLNFFRNGIDLSDYLQTLHVGLEFAQWPSEPCVLSVEGLGSNASRQVSSLELAREIGRAHV